MDQLTNTDKEFLLEVDIEELLDQSRVWMSRILLWKTELGFFQKLLDSNSTKFNSADEKKSEDHFQNLIIYYNGEVLDQYKQSVRRHKKNLHALSTGLATEPVQEEATRRSHIELLDKVDSFDEEFRKHKHEFIEFMEKVI